MPALKVDLPEGSLDLPYACDRPWILRFESGLYLDGLLRRVARVSGAVDRALALRLRRLREGRGYVRLGFARFADYARERLGLAERTAQELVRLGEALERLPSLDAVLKDGRITWSAALQVARIAGAQDEDEWVRLAQRVSVRELTCRVREALEQKNGGCSRERDGPRSGETRGADGKDNARSSYAGSRDEGLSGGDLSAERCRAESTETGSASTPGSSAVDPLDGDRHDDRGAESSTEPESDDPPVRLSVACSGRIARLWDAAIELCEMMAQGPMAECEAPEYVLADLISGLPPVPDEEPPCLPRRAPLKLRRGGFVLAACGSGAGCEPRPAEELGSHPLPADVSSTIASVLACIEEEVPHDPFDLDASMRALVEARHGSDLDLARLLRNFHWLSLARHIGFASFEQYVQERLGISVRRARFLLQLDRRLIYYPEVARAVREGRIGTVAALLVCRVALEQRTERVWIERARRRTTARLREEVRWAEREARRSGDWEVLPPPAGRLPSELDSVTQELRARQTSAGGEDDDAGGAEVGNAAVEPWQTSAHPRFLGDTVRVEFLLRGSAVELWEEARQRLGAASGEGLVPDEQVLYEAALAFLLTYLPLWVDEVDNGHPIAVRDRFRCTVPGCTNRCGTAHHVRFRSQGGSDDPSNLTFPCPVHHLEIIHRGFIRVSGRAPDRLVFEMGIRPDGTASEVFVNEERLIFEGGETA
jgi:hypothetical protein